MNEVLFRALNAVLANNREQASAMCRYMKDILGPKGLRNN